MKLRTLANGLVYVNQDFCKQQTITDYSGAKIELLGTGEEPDYDALLEFFRLHKAEAKTDAMLAVFLHQALPLTRREAACREFWHYLSVVLLGEYTSARFWNDKKGEVPRARYLGAWWDNSIARLWWIAELTKRPKVEDSYGLTTLVASDAETYQQVIDLGLSANLEMLEVLAEVIFPKNAKKLVGDDIKLLFKRCNASRATHLLDLLGPDEMRSEIYQLIA